MGPFREVAGEVGGSPLEASRGGKILGPIPRRSPRGLNSSALSPFTATWHIATELAAGHQVWGL